ncbi:MAG: metal-dependent hydrolase [Verrucomicrobiales bacterium]
MDSLTQAALGAVIGELTLGKKLGWRAAAWGAFFGTLPDLDVLFSPWLSEAQRLTSHRGLSHSLLVCFLAPALLAYPLSRLHRARGIGYAAAFLFLFLDWTTHVLIDCFTTYGTQIFEPFSSARVSFNNLYIIDLFFTVPLLLSLLLIFRHEPTSRLRRRINTGALALSTCYILLSFGMKSIATKAISARLADDKRPAELVATSPTFSNILLWRGLAETPDAYLVTYWSPFDNQPAKIDCYPKRHELLAKLPESELLSAVLWFTRGHYLVRENEQGQPVVIDIRFTEVREPARRYVSPIFQWHLETDESGKITSAPQLRPAELDLPAALGLTRQRLFGDLESWESLPPALFIAPPSPNP